MQCHPVVEFKYFNKLLAVIL